MKAKTVLSIVNCDAQHVSHPSSAIEMSNLADELEKRQDYKDLEWDDNDAGDIMVCDPDGNHLAIVPAVWAKPFKKEMGW